MSYYLQKGHSLKELLSLNSIEKIFYIESMVKEKEEQAKYDSHKMEVFLKSLGGEG